MTREAAPRSGQKRKKVPPRHPQGWPGLLSPGRVIGTGGALVGTALAAVGFTEAIHILPWLLPVVSDPEVAVEIAAGLALAASSAAVLANGEKERRESKDRILATKSTCCGHLHACCEGFSQAFATAASNPQNAMTCHTAALRDWATARGCLAQTVGDERWRDKLVSFVDEVRDVVQEQLTSPSQRRKWDILRRDRNTASAERSERFERCYGNLLAMVEDLCG